MAVRTTADILVIILSITYIERLDRRNFERMKNENKKKKRKLLAIEDIFGI